jgi:hypothetical protein
MRCQKARSCLSAYCNNELGERQSLEIRGHLASCASCREAERSWLALREATKEIPTRKVSNDFNARLLNRIAEERFTETRQSVPQPSSLGWLRFRQWIPALAGSAAVVLMVATGAIQRGATLLPAFVNEGKTTLSTDIALDDSYLTAQPGLSQQRRLGTHLHEGQSIHQSMALSDRVSSLSRGLSPQIGFGAKFANSSNTRYGDNPYQSYGRRTQLMPGSIVIRREIGFSGERMRIYLVPTPDSQTSHGGEAARY